MYRFVVRTGLTKGGVFLAVALGLITGYYTWKPVFDPAEKHKLLNYTNTTPETSGNEC